MSIDPNLRTRIDALMQRHPVLLFMKGSPDAPQCGFSARAVAALGDAGADFAHVDVLADPELREGIKAYGDWPTIPQLYIGGELVGGSDIIEQMAASGELHAALGLQPPDRTPPQVTVSPAAALMLRQAIADAGGDVVVTIDVDPHYRTRLHLASRTEHGIDVDADGVPLHFDAGSARRAHGLSIDFADDARGRGLVIDNPNAPKPVRDLAPAEAADRVRASTLTLVDVRPPAERALAEAPVPCLHMDAGVGSLEALDKATPIAFLCHAGGRSAQAAEHFRKLGFREVYNIAGGIDAWAAHDPSIPRY